MPSVDEMLVDTTILEYDNKLQLSVMKDSRIPAFDSLNLSTQTFTKANGEETDPDPMGTFGSLHTQTYSATNSEITDSDFDKPPLSNALVTSTFTRQQIEGSDND